MSAISSSSGSPAYQPIVAAPQPKAGQVLESNQPAKPTIVAQPQQQADSDNDGDSDKPGALDVKG